MKYTITLRQCKNLALIVLLVICLASCEATIFPKDTGETVSSGVLPGENGSGDDDGSIEATININTGKIEFDIYGSNKSTNFTVLIKNGAVTGTVYEWYINGIKQENSNTQVFYFKPTEAKTYTLNCVIYGYKEGIYSVGSGKIDVSYSIADIAALR